MQVYNAVVISQLVYGLETMYLNDSLIKRLDAFHMRGIRHIMGIDHAYWVNFIVLKHQSEKQIKRISHIIADKKIKLLGHVIRADEKDPLFQTTFTQSGEFQTYKKQSVGRSNDVNAGKAGRPHFR